MDESQPLLEFPAPSEPEPAETDDEAIADDKGAREPRVTVETPTTDESAVAAGVRPIPPSISRLALDLSLGPSFRGKTFAESRWNWPAAVRAAILLIDHLAAAGDPATPLLPARVMLDDAGALQLHPTEPADAALFLAPEMAGGDPANETAAVYHVAALTHALLVGHPPIGDISGLNRAAPDVPDRLYESLLRALAVNPGQRTQSLADLRAQLLFVLVPPAWYEEVVPRLPLSAEKSSNLIDRLDRLQYAWLRLRDRIPWQRLGRGRRRLGELTAQPRIRRGLTIAGGLAALLIYLILLTDLL